MDIEVYNKELVSKFIDGEIVFKITSIKGDIGMVTAYNDYKNKVDTHQYIPFLFLLTFYQQAAYTYGCMNRSYQKPRDRKFIFWWRKLRTKEWNKWFVVNPYTESLFIE